MGGYYGVTRWLVVVTDGFYEVFIELLACSRHDLTRN